MNNQEKYKEDHLSRYINPGMTEKAPEGFTSNVMTRVRMETGKVNASVRYRNKSLIPVISAVVAIFLIVVAFFIPGSETDSIAIPFAERLKNVKFSLPEINLESVFGFDFPSILIYVFFGILLLTLFDRALFGVFHREK